LKNAFSTIDSITKLQREKIDDQNKIIQLKDQVIEKRSVFLDEVKSTVQTEMKSFSSIVKKNCPTPLTRKTIEVAIKSVCVAFTLVPKNVIA
jgi:hypothetical protein